MTDHRVAPRKEGPGARDPRFVMGEGSRARRSFVIGILLAALLIGLEGARVVYGDQRLLGLMQTR
jgi:hypothetical protein